MNPKWEEQYFDDRMVDDYDGSSMYSMPKMHKMDYTMCHQPKMHKMDYDMCCERPKMPCKCEKKCVKTFKCTYKLYKTCCYRLHKVCPRCNNEFDYHQHRGMCPRCD
ncbi:hypothetical protein SDC9_14743 [bioreactor metagenome]|uniref:Uncharacterized protein n=1 Tax=bioreactor metagenome TaxID=1076179 RepID=A0A644TPY3_9ZZZZ